MSAVDAPRVLAIGAHPDDIELGCGATLARAVAAGGSVTMVVLTDGRLGPTALGSRRSEQEQAAALLGAELRWADLPDGELRHGPELVARLGRDIADVQPDLILTHAVSDSHQDHVAAAQATVAAARTHPHLLHYESPTTLAFQPTVFTDTTGFGEVKADLLRCHLSQVVGAARVDLEAVEAQLRFRGFQGRVREAEAFEPTRSLLRIGPTRPASAGSAAPALDLRLDPSALR